MGGKKRPTTHFRPGSHQTELSVVNPVEGDRCRGGLGVVIIEDEQADPRLGGRSLAGVLGGWPRSRDVRFGRAGTVPFESLPSEF